MSNFDRTRAALIKRFKDNWPSAGVPADLPLTAIEFPNSRFSRPNNAPWGRLAVLFGDRASAAIGGARVRIIGELVLQIFIPENGGTKPALDGGDHLASIFDNESIELLDSSGWIRCEFVTSRPVGLRDGYEQTNFAVPFEQDDNR